MLSELTLHNGYQTSSNSDLQFHQAASEVTTTNKKLKLQWLLFFKLQGMK